MSRTIWRLAKARHAKNDDGTLSADVALSGEGSMLFDGRWHWKDNRVVYASESLSLALLEVLANMDSPPESDDEYVAVSITFEEEHLQKLPEPLPDDWNASDPLPKSTKDIGTKWINSQASLILEVPSVVVPEESNYLINPNHPDFEKLLKGHPDPFPIDERLWKFKD